VCPGGCGYVDDDENCEFAAGMNAYSDSQLLLAEDIFL
jgi:hypothetical protein